MSRKFQITLYLASILGIQLSWDAEARTIPLSSDKPEVQKIFKQRIKQLVIKLKFSELQIDKLNKNKIDFESVKLDSLPNTSEVGKPSLPFYSVLLTGKKDDLIVKIDTNEQKKIQTEKIIPAQKENCRCNNDKINAFIFDLSKYTSQNETYKIESLGDYRGQPISRLTVYPVQYDTHSSRLTIAKKINITVKSKTNKAIQGIDSILDGNRNQQDYLIITKTKFLNALKPWMQWKTQNRGTQFRTLVIDNVSQDADQISRLIKDEFTRSPFQNALIVGSQTEIITHFVYTDSDDKTPSDLPYFAMGGKDDIIPDVFAGRLVADNEQNVTAQTLKWLQYEQMAASNTFSKGIGIASNEGSGPSDEEYVKSIEAKFKEIENVSFTHFFENDKNSNPIKFNEAMNLGASWVTYLGHGSGDSWPSFNQTYSTSDIKNLKNSKTSHPIWIDVACQNGGLLERYAGERLSNESDNFGSPIGAVAFYGGTVNISWHPPAIMARGVAFKMLEQKTDERYLGKMLQLGQLYLSENHSDLNDVTYNQRWYHLQGDPSLLVRLK